MATFINRTNGLHSTGSFLQVQAISDDAQVLSILAFAMIRELAEANLINCEERFHAERNVIEEERFYDLAEWVNDVVLYRTRQADIHATERSSIFDHAFAF